MDGEQGPGLEVEIEDLEVLGIMQENGLHAQRVEFPCPVQFDFPHHQSTSRLWFIFRRPPTAGDASVRIP